MTNQTTSEWQPNCRVTADGDEYQKPTVTQFVRLLEDMRKEIGCDGVRIGAHNLRSRVRFADTQGNTYRLIMLDADQLPGCGCWDGICLRLEREPDDT